VDDGAGDAMPLDFVQINKRHTGEYLAQMVRYIFGKFGLENRVRNALRILSILSSRQYFNHSLLIIPKLAHLTLLTVMKKTQSKNSLKDKLFQASI
jgi:hypothetical protein